MRVRLGKNKALFVVVLLVSLACVAAPLFAWAEGDDVNPESSGDNIVNPQQLPDSSFIYDTTISDLAAADTYFDKQTVQVTGEAIGDLIKDVDQPGMCWIEVASSDAASNASIAVWMSREDAKKIDTFGKYGTTGTILQVRGTFHLVCPEHTGISDLHAENVNVAERGKHSPDVFEANMFVPGIVAVIIGFIALGVFYFIRERQR